MKRADSDNKLENFIINFKADFNREPPMPRFVPLKPQVFHPDVLSRMAEFRAIPSLYD